eukprot:c11709_g1_i1.p1 GENE.c11709_g1_i1~~c11709_g1_i1.p1  ORF type:complete len:406 (+),score=83.36 c11709_g1_i1:40-1218(+)
MIARVVLCLSLCACAFSGPVAGGDNFGIPIAPLPIPFDKCSVAAANDADMRITIIAWGYNNEYWMTQQTEAGDVQEWKSIGGFFAGGPTVIRNANNNIVVFGRGGDRKVWYKILHEGGDADNWVPLGGKLLSGRISALLDPQGLIHIFARGRDSTVWEKRQYANGTEAVWGEWETLGGVVTSNVATIVDAEGIIHLFVRGVDGHLWSTKQHLQDDGSLTWSNPWVASENSIYLSSAATIVARLNAQNLVEVVVRGADKAMWHTREAVNDERGVVWAPFKSLGGIFSSAPTIQMNSDSLLTIYARGPEKGVWYKQQAHHPVDSPSDSWSKWVPLGGRFSSGIDTVRDAHGYIHIFGRGLDTSIWSRGQMFANGTVGFFGQWTNLGGHFRSFQC